MSKAVLWLGALCGLAGVTAPAQEAVRPSLARVVTQETTIPTVYNLKAGPVLFRVAASLRAEYVDNVNLSNGRLAPIESDFILSPQLGLDLNWTISRLNTLHLRTTLGYTKYFSHPELDSSSLLFSPDSVLAFNLYVGDFRITFRDQFSYEEDPVGQNSVSNVEKFGRFTNTAGIDVLWDLNDLILTLGYDHTNLITTTSTDVNGQDQDLSGLDHTIDQISASAFFRFSSVLGGGLEATASESRFPSDSRGDYARVSIGPFLESQLTRYTKISASAGYQKSFLSHDSDIDLRGQGSVGAFRNGGGDGGSYYANVTIQNRLNRFLVGQLSVGHENVTGLFSQESETTYANLNFRYQVSPQIAISTAISYNDTEEHGSFSPLVGTVGGDSFESFGLSISTEYQITKKLSASLGYQFTRRIGDSGGLTSLNQNYTQNRFILTLGYQF